MNLSIVLKCLEAKWREYLIERNHHMGIPRSNDRIIKSHSGITCYRWLLFAGGSPERVLTKPELSYIRRQLMEARKSKESAYLVVGFATEPGRIIVIPARTALKIRRVYSDRAGISWD